jgi:hypothetical protein
MDPPDPDPKHWPRDTCFFSPYSVLCPVIRKIRADALSVADPISAVFGLPGSGSVSQRYGSFYHQAKKVRKTLSPTVL